MVQTGSLVGRFVAGSNAIQISSPDLRAIFTGMGQDLKQANELGRRLVTVHSDVLDHLQDAHAEKMMAINEIRWQLDEISSVVTAGFDQVSNAIVHFETALWAELAGIKWVLGQMDGKLGELVHLVKFPRETQARELVEDGVKALATGNLDDAEYCLTQAVKTKRTSFQSHMNLGFLFLEKERADNAITHFKKACDYAPHTDAEAARIFAIETLARTHFAARQYPQARSVMEQALALRSQHRQPSQRSDYLYAVYCAQATEASKAVSLVVELCRTEPRFFGIAATDVDLEPIQQPLMESLNDLATREHHEGTRLLSEAENVLARSVSEVADRSQVDSEVDTLGETAKASKLWLAANNYSGAWRAVAACTRIISVASQLPRWANLRSALNTAIVQQRQLAEKFATMDQENSKREEEFDRKQAGAKESGENVGWVVFLCCMGIFLLFLLAAVIQDSWLEGWGWAIFVGLVGAIVAGIPALIVSVVLGWVIVGPIWTQVIRARQWTDNPELRKTAVEAEEAQSTVTRLTGELTSLEKTTTQALTELRELLTTK